MTDHVNSYYAATANRKDARPPLQGAITADVCVIGAGFTGTNTALELAERGVKNIVLLEAVKVGFGASGRNGGQIVNGYSRDLDVIARTYGESAGRVIGALADTGGDIIRARVAKYGIACALQHGMLITGFNARQMRGFEHHIKTWNSFGHDQFELLEGAAALSPHVVSQRYAGGLLDKKGGHLHPLNLVQGEAAAFESLGGTIFENSAVTAVDLTTKTVKTAEGEVRAKTIVLAGNAYLHGVLPKLETRIMPVSTQVMATEPLGALATKLLPSGVCVEDANYFLDYFRRTPEGRLLYGGGVVYGGQDAESVIAKIRPLMEKTFPELKHARIDYAWNGNFALTLTRFPQIGSLAPDVYFSHGDSGHGVTTTHLLARTLAEAITGDRAVYETFAALPYFPFPGGRLLRVPLTIAGSWWYRLRDRLGV
ncbi:FAD-binding oxidoreductase [Acidocella sp.]|uniref:NAD(P)/FAD-dependent oxidoreductase n=1 Tax=Acidocella sp. TaxID=50710 RepID=UPI00260CB479|nr:FAD-binding oxidoreductase [Acidocella sp.]